MKILERTLRRRLQLRSLESQRNKIMLTDLLKKKKKVRTDFPYRLATGLRGSLSMLRLL